MPIDVRAHYVPPSILDAVESRACEFGLTVVQHPPSCTCAFHFDYGLKVRPFFAKSIEPMAERRVAKDGQGIDRHVLSSWADIFACGLPKTQAKAWHRFLNIQTRNTGRLYDHRRIQPFHAETLS